jgi:methylase of polypeptide subunit release factors
LAVGGLLALEIGETQKEPIIQAFTSKKYKDIATKNDYSDRPRFVLARYG